MAALSEARKRFPQAGLPTYYHGLALSQIKHHDEAMRAFERALVEAGNSQPDLLNADFYFDYGAAAEQAGQQAKATELFRKSIELDPDNAATILQLSRLHVGRAKREPRRGRPVHPPRLGDGP